MGLWGEDDFYGTFATGRRFYDVFGAGRYLMWHLGYQASKEMRNMHWP